ncbi:MAG: hypothetical protein V7631_2506 [Massilia sp.]|jgi:hypothetical protein
MTAHTDRQQPGGLRKSRMRCPGAFGKNCRHRRAQSKATEHRDSRPQDSSA